MRKILGIVFLALAAVSATNLVKKLATETGGSSSGSRAYDAGGRVGMFAAPIILGALGLWLMATEGTARRMPAPPPRRPGASLPPPGDPSLRGGMNTFASNPARVRVDWMRFFSVRPGGLAVIVCAFILGIGMAIFLHPVPGVIMILVSISVCIKMIKAVNAQFWAGDVCPAVVLSENPGLVAVYTDLVAGGGVARPAIKIMRQPVHKLVTGPAVVGTRLATVAMYRAPVTQGAWKDFTPEIIGLFVSDPAEVDRVTASITEREWQELDNQLARIPEAHEGLYRMWGAHVEAATTVRPATDNLKWAIPVMAILGALLLLRIAVTWNLKRHEAQNDAAQVQNYSGTPTAPRPAPAANDSTTQSTPPKISPTPVSAENTSTEVANSIELNDRVATFTNLQGRVFTNVKLVRADQVRLTYLADGGGGSVSLANVPLPFLLEIGVPTNWPVIQRRMSASGSATASANVANSGNYAIGDRVLAEWGGKWQSGVIVKRQGGSVQVRLADPTVRIPIWMGTNFVKYQ